MDSITQITLGGAVGELVLGKKIGNKAVYWGALAGTIPDLDMVLIPFLDAAYQVAYHRGFSLSIVFAIVFSPILAYMIQKIHRQQNVKFKDWLHLTFWCLITHPFLDCFTTYGTQLFQPFSSYPVAFNAISVIDPAYTIPFLLCLLLVLFLKRSSSIRKKVLVLGISISSLYLFLTIVNKVYITSVFESSLRQQGIKYSNILTIPTFFNNILWRCVAEEDDFYWEGYYSLFDREKNIQFYLVAKNKNLLEPYLKDKKLQRLLRFTKNKYSVAQKGNQIIINDMRFGRIIGWVDPNSDFIFSFGFYSTEPDINKKLKIFRVRPSIRINKTIWSQFFARIKGKEFPGLFSN